VVHPLKVSALPGTAGLLVTGISPRRALDDAYRSFIGLVAKQAAAAISEAKAYEAERRRAEELAELDRAKTAFFSNVSHEFRTPLTLMLGPIEDATNDPRVPPEVHDRLTLAQRNATRLQKLVNTLLDFSRIEAGRVQASYVATDLVALTRDLASTFRSAMEKAGLAFSVECDTLGAPVFVDREMWEKIVLNLLSNAFKFTLDGSVSVRLRRDGDAAVLEVADTGAGVPAHEIPRLFERFHRVEGTQGRTHEGSGIGLALVQELVKLHGASIDASSELGAGTTFRVRIPFGSAHLPAERVKATRAQASTAIEARTFVQEAMRWLETNDDGETASSVSTLNGESAPVRDRRFATTFDARIVLADDNADMRAYVTDLLAPYYRIEAVADGERALAAARRALPDLIISDVMMPRLDGFGLLRAVRADPALQSVPVVFLSARAGEEARIEGLDAGADDYLVKPFSARELLARIGALLELRKMRAAAQEASRLRTAQYETLLNEAPIGVYLIDSEFCVREVNPTAREVFSGYPNLIGADFSDVIHTLWPGDYAHEIVRLFRQTLATGEPHLAPERVITRAETGMAEYYEWQISRIPLPDGRYGVVCYFRDISQHVLSRARLQAADRQKDEFLAMLAHELRNPLAPIRNAGEVLSRTSPADARAQAAIGIVHRQVATLTRLVDDLLDVSRITQGRIELKRQPVQIAEVISQAIEMVEPLMKEKRHRVSVTSYQAMRVNGDPARLIQCVANVLTNAAKYTDPGGEIRLESRNDGGEAVLTVTDNGVGISKELLLRVFDLFVQSDRTLDRAQGGLGIGLSVVKRLVEMHGGRVAASSPGPGAGATFEIRLPLIERNDISTTAAKQDDVPARKILIVDDNVDAADSLVMILRLDGHEVEAVYTAHDALERAAAIRPDVALLDIGLPKMNGYELAQHLRSQPDLRDIRLIALTGYGQGEDRERTRAAGFDDHLVKPADLAVLQKALSLPSERR
jgi:PAS domain S-box-containing protein